MPKEIIWEKWSDPLLGNVKRIDDSGDSESDDFHDDVFSELQEEFDFNSSKLINTPFGMFSVSDEALLGSRFNFWIMHTNFDITEKIVEIVKKTPGVESLDVYSRYRLRIGVPNSGLFDAPVVRKQINDSIMESENEASNVILDKMINFDPDDVSD